MKSCVCKEGILTRASVESSGFWTSPIFYVNGERSLITLTSVPIVIIHIVNFTIIIIIIDVVIICGVAFVSGIWLEWLSV